MIYSRTFNYLSYILLSRHKFGHGIHSPFVFNLVTRVFRNKTDKTIVSKAEAVRKKMITDMRMISFTDPGAAGNGSLKEMKISKIAGRSPVNKKYGRLLSNMAEEFGKNMILELGTSFGISTLYLALSKPDAEIYTIEGSDVIAEIAQRNFADAGTDNIKQFRGSFDDVLPVIKAEGKVPGLVFIDGNHRKEPLLKYFELIAGFCDSNTAVIIDDINYSKEMNEAWEIIKKQERVTVSINVFQMGIVFFRQGINHNDYTIRY